MMELCKPICYSANADTHTWKYELNRLYTAVLNLLPHENIAFIPTKYLFNQLTLLAIKAKSEKSFSLSLEDFKHEFVYNCSDILNLKTDVDISAPIVSLSEHIKSLGAYYPKTAKRLLDNVYSGQVTSVLDCLTEHIIKNSSDFKSINDFSEYIVNELLKNAVINTDISPIFSIESDNTIAKGYLQVYSIAYQTAVNSFEENLNTENTTDTACLYIYKNFNKQISLNDILAEVKSSKSIFTKSFKTDTGYSFVDYRNLIRIKHACILLLISDMLISEISSCVGFETARHFFTKFNELTGYTPAKYRLTFKKIN